MSRGIFNIKGRWLIVTLCLIVVFSLVAGGLITGCAPPEDKSSTMTFTLQAEEYTVTKDEDGYDVIEMQGFSPSTSPGDPMLPHKVYNIAVPPDIVWSSLKLNIVWVESYVLEGIYDIKPAPPFIPVANGDDDELNEEWGEGKDIVNGMNMKVYGIDANFPESCSTLLPYSQMRKWKFTKVDFTPVQYNPVSKALTLIDSVTIEIGYDRSGAELDASLMGDDVMDDVASQILFNYETAEPWYRAESPINGQPQYDYVIITTQRILDPALSTWMMSFKAHKEKQGHSVLIITEQQWDVPGAQAPDQKAERIREWLKQNYVLMGIKYVLLIGDPTPVESTPEYDELSIPMKMCWPYGWGSDEELDQAPTDYFYADLHDNWDADADSYYGELGDCNNGTNGGIDFTPDVYVGRIPVYDIERPTRSDLDEILRKIIYYETATDIGWRRSALLPMSGAWDQVGEKITNDCLKPAGFSSWRQYQQPEACDDTILHYDDSGWSVMMSNTNSRTASGWGTGPRDVFAVGTAGTISHYDGNGWTSMNIGTIKSLNDVWGSCSSDVFAVGEKVAGGGIILRYNGTVWTSVMGTTYPLYGVWGSGPSDVFAVGGPTILHCNGTSWTRITVGTWERLYGVWGSGPKDVFAVGEDLLGTNGTVLHYDGTSWAPVMGTTYPLYGVWGGPNGVFAVGGGGTIVHYNGTSWTPMTSGTTERLYSVWGSGPNDVFAVGTGGAIRHYDDVSGWTKMNSPTGRDLYGVWGISSNDVFAGSEWCFQTSYFPDENLKGNNVTRDRWASNDYGIVCWMGHGGPQYAYIGYNPNCWDGIIFGTEYCPLLDDEHPAFVYQGSCDNGWPEDPNNLQYSILKHGGIGTVAATRAASVTGLDTIGCHYVQRLVSGNSSGEALYLTKYELVPPYTSLTNLYVFNLYGDPSTSLGILPNTHIIDLANNTATTSQCSPGVSFQDVILDRGQAVVAINMSNNSSVLEMKIEIQDPEGSCLLNIGNSPTNDGGGGDYGSFANDSELTVGSDATNPNFILQLYANQYFSTPGAVVANLVPLFPPSGNVTTWILRVKIADQKMCALVENTGALRGDPDDPAPESPYIFRLGGLDKEASGGLNDCTYYAAFNRVIYTDVHPDRTGSGVTKVTFEWRTTWPGWDIP